MEKNQERLVEKQRLEKIVDEKLKQAQKLEKSKKEIILNKIEHFIRKLAHFSLYTLVGILIMSLMSTYKIELIKRISISLLTGVLYAISDEVHQFFVPGRGPMAQDVFLDSLGVIFGILIVIGIIRIYKNLKK